MAHEFQAAAAAVPSTFQAKNARRRALGAGVLLVLLALLLYLFTIDNGLQPGELVGGDLITHHYAQVEARPSNAPGYPLYTMGGWLWFHSLRPLVQAAGRALPNPIPILSSYNTLFALLALALLYAIVCRLTRSPARPAGNWPLAWLISAFYAVTYFFWYYATTTENYSSAIAQNLAIVYVYLIWRDAIHRQQTAQPAGKPRQTLARADYLLIGLAFLCGLALAHMLTVAFIVPPLVIAVIWEQPRVLRSWRLVLLAAAAAFVPLLSYGYVYVRGAAHPEWWGKGNWQSAQQWFWAFISTAQGRDELERGVAARCAFFDGGFPELIWQELSPLLLALGLAGLAFLEKHLRFVLIGTLAIYLIFDWLYRCGNWFQVILPAYPLILLGAAVLLDRWETHFAGGRRAWLRFAPALLLMAAIAWRVSASWPRADSRDRPGDTGLDHAAILLDQPLPSGANLFAQVDDALALDYLIHVWQIRPDLKMVSSKEAGRALRRGESVLTTLAAAPLLLAELPQGIHPQRAAVSPDWLELTTTPAQTPTAQTAVGRQVAPGVTLAGYTVHVAPTGKPVTAVPRGADVTLYWQLDPGWPADLGISLRPTQAGAWIPDPAKGGGAIVQIDASAPLAGLLETAGAPTTAPDAYRVPLPAGADGITLVIYRKNGGSFTDLLTLPLAVAGLAGRQ